MRQRGREAKEVEETEPKREAMKYREDRIRDRR
jgi:hypothetical protein